MVTVVDYDPGWPARFESLRNEFAHALSAAGVPVVQGTAPGPSGRGAANIDDYGKLKSATVQRILAAAGLSAAERTSIDANQVPSHDDLPR